MRTVIGEIGRIVVGCWFRLLRRARPNACGAMAATPRRIFVGGLGQTRPLDSGARLECALGKRVGARYDPYNRRCKRQEVSRNDYPVTSAARRIIPFFNPVRK